PALGRFLRRREIPGDHLRKSPDRESGRGPIPCGGGAHHPRGDAPSGAQRRIPRRGQGPVGQRANRLLRQNIAQPEGLRAQLEPAARDGGSYRQRRGGGFARRASGEGGGNWTSCVRTSGAPALSAPRRIEDDTWRDFSSIWRGRSKQGQ